MPVKKNCVVCNKEFSVPPVRAESAKTCSNACAGVHRGRTMRSGRMTANCPKCGKIFDFPKCHDERRKFCSYACKDSSNTVPRPELSGSKNPSWKGGLSMRKDGYVYQSVYGHPFARKGLVLQHRIRMEERMKELAPDHPFLVEVDGVKCLSMEIEVHHIDEDRANNDISNLLACTKTAHKRIHRGLKLELGSYWPSDFRQPVDNDVSLALQEKGATNE